MKNLIENNWQYDIKTNTDIYGYTLYLFKNNIKVLEQGVFGSKSIAKSRAIDYVILDEFGINMND